MSHSEPHTNDTLEKLNSVDMTQLNQPEGFNSEELATWKGTNLLESTGFAEMKARKDRLQETIDRYTNNESSGLSKRLTTVLDHWLNRSKLENMLIATDDGLIVAHSSTKEVNEQMVAIAALFENIVKRVQNGQIMSHVRELSLRGNNGELISIRNFNNLDNRFFLIAYAPSQVTYRMVTNRVLKEAGELLIQHFDQ